MKDWQWEQRNQQFWRDIQNPNKQGWHNVVDIVAIAVVVTIALTVCVGTEGAGCYAAAAFAGGFIRGSGHARVEGGSFHDAMVMGIYQGAIAAAFTYMVMGALPQLADVTVFGEPVLSESFVSTWLTPPPTWYGQLVLALLTRQMLPDYLPDNIDRFADGEKNSSQDLSQSGCHIHDTCYLTPQPVPRVP